MNTAAKAQGENKILRALINVPPLLSVAGFVLFWLFFLIFGHLVHVKVFTGDPKDSMSEPAMWLGYILLIGLLPNLFFYPILWPFLSLFKRELFPGARYAWSVFLASVAAFCCLLPSIVWLMD